MKFRHKETGEVYEPKRYEGGYRVVIEVQTLEDVRKFSRMAHSARMNKVGESHGNVVEFSKLEEIR